MAGHSGAPRKECSGKGPRSMLSFSATRGRTVRIRRLAEVTSRGHTVDTYSVACDSPLRGVKSRASLPMDFLHGVGGRVREEYSRSESAGTAGRGEKLPNFRSMRNRVMQCPCGGSTKDHDVIQKGERVASYAMCSACGRVHWREDAKFISRTGIPAQVWEAT